MKRILLGLSSLLLLGTMQAGAQTIFSDDFSNAALPNWTITNLSTSNVVWHHNATNTSAGQAAGTFDYPGASNGNILADSDADGDQSGNTPEHTVITSKNIDCSAASNVVLSFVELFGKYQADTPRVYVSTDSVNWTMVHNPAAGLGTNQTTANPNFVEVNLTSIAAGSDSFYIRFDWKGAYDYWWFVDDVRLFTPSTFEVQADEAGATLTNGCNLSNSEPISITFRNKGLTSIDSVMAYYQVNGGTVVAEKVHLPSPLGYDTAYTYNFSTTADFSAANIYNITAWVQLAGDTVATNDSAFTNAISADPINPSTAYTTSFEIPGIGNDVSALSWTNEDSNNDGASWHLSAASPNIGTVHFRTDWNPDGTTPANDWLFSPCLQLSSSKAYKVDFFDEVGQDNNGLYPEKLELKAGTTKSGAGMTQNIYDFGLQQNTSYEERLAAFKPSTSGIYYVGFHCYSDANEWFLDVDDVTISELAGPDAVFTSSMNGSTVSVSDGSTELITDWSWSWGDGQSSTGQNPGTHTYTTPGTYTICLTVTNLAGTDSVCHTVTISGINDIDASAEVAVYPNPTNSAINVMLSRELSNNAQIEIINTIGETVISRKATGNNVEKFNLDKLAQGVYYVRITSEGVKAMKKFVYTR
ncbi:MAG: PKD domain-containing protein [Chitinophagales bacterium]